ncbi:hypothetical protein AVEN_189331-1 [Araneus ventricosus]|uniref:Uncharacterized protein n=1 Tax=Araneus ventricosus TaxID=182803 RepID=A0A4Y2LWA1_ARAVE|nr:hypothetical protein AVEN_189331-1 [Araneus ventricosus]
MRCVYYCFVKCSEFSLKYGVVVVEFSRPLVFIRSTHRSLDEINNQPQPANKQNNRPPQLYHQPKKTYLNRNSQNNSTLACIFHPTANLMSPIHAFLLLSPGTSHARDRSSVSVSQAQPRVRHTSNLASTASCKSTCDYSRTQNLV